MGGKSAGQPGAYDDPNPQPFRDSMRALTEGAMKNLGSGFWGDQMPTFGAQPAAPGAPPATSAPAAPGALVPEATSAPAAGNTTGATDPAAPAASTIQGSITTSEPEPSMGSSLAASVAPNAYWSDQMNANSKKSGATPAVTQT